MPQQPTAYHRPQNLPEALQLLAQPDTFPLAGGTKLLAGDVDGAVVDLQALGLNQMEMSHGRLRLGAMVTLSQLADWLRAQADADGPRDLLLTAVAQAGPNTYRHAATLGGSIGSRPADSELLAALLVLETTLTLHNPDPTHLSLAEYLAAERPSGLISQISLNWQPGRAAAERVARTPADAPIVAIIGWQPAADNLRLAASGIAPRPLRLTAAETALAGGDASAAVQVAQAACTHPGDFRGDTAYRREMTAVLLRRVLAAVA